MSQFDNSLLRSVYNATFDFLRHKPDEKEEILLSIDRLRFDDIGFDILNATLFELHNQELLSSKDFISRALNCLTLGHQIEALEHFKTAKASIMEFFKSDKSFDGRALAARMILLCMLYIYDYFTDVGGVSFIYRHLEFQQIFQLLLESDEVLLAISSEIVQSVFPTEGYMTHVRREQILSELSAIRCCIYEYTGLICPVSDACGNAVKLIECRPTSFIAGDHTHHRVSHIVSAVQSLYFSCVNSSSVRMWSLEDRSLQHKFECDHDVTCLAVIPESRLAVGTKTGNVLIFSLLDGSLASNNVFDASPVTALSATGNRLFVQSHGTVRVVDLRDHQQITYITGMDHAISCYAVSGDALYAAERESGAVQKWNLQSGICVDTAAVHPEKGTVHKMLINDTRLFACYDDKLVYVWDLTRLGSLLTVLEGHTHNVLDILVDRDTLVTLCSLEIILWDVDSLKEIARLPAVSHNSGRHVSFLCMCFLDNTLFTSTENGTIEVWNGRVVTEAICSAGGKVAGGL
jgi:WD40 repeat protein